MLNKFKSNYFLFKINSKYLKLIRIIYPLTIYNNRQNLLYNRTYILSTILIVLYEVEEEPEKVKDRKQQGN